jgi:hypothetical protein
VAGKDLGDQSTARLGQRHDDEAPIVRPPLLGDQTTPDEIADDDRGIAVAPQQLGAEIALAQRPVVQQRLQHAELADGEPGRSHHAAHARGHRLGGPHELDVRVQRRRLRRCARIARRHGSNLKGL